jgi:hypothetical protein
MRDDQRHLCTIPEQVPVPKLYPTTAIPAVVATEAPRRINKLRACNKPAGSDSHPGHHSKTVAISLTESQRATGWSPRLTFTLLDQRLSEIDNSQSSCARLGRLFDVLGLLPVCPSSGPNCTIYQKHLNFLVLLRPFERNLRSDTSLCLFCQDHMHGVLRGNASDTTIPESGHVDADE